MAKKIVRLVALACVFAAVLSLLPVRAKDGRDFAGFYELSDVSESGSTCQLTFTVRVFNYSDADVNNATLVLQDPLVPRAVYATFTGVEIRDRGNVRLSTQVTVPRREYESWLKGGSPALDVQYTSAEGKSLRRRVELSRMPVGEE